MGSNNSFSKIIADVFPPGRRVNTHLDAAEQQTDRTSAFIELLTLTDDQLISALISSTWLLLTLLISVEAVRVHLVFLTLLVHFGLVFLYIYIYIYDTVQYVMCCYSSEVIFT